MNESPSPPSLDVPGGNVGDDRPCVRCGYNLRGLCDAGVCPECGTPVLDSLRGNLLRYSAPEYVARLALGARLVWWSLAVMLMMFVAVIAAAPFAAAVGGAAPALSELIIPAGGVASTGLSLVGWWLLTAPDPAASHDVGARARVVVRVSVAVAAACFAVNLALGSAFGTAAPFGGVAGRGATISGAVVPLLSASVLIGKLAWIVQFLASMVYLQSLAPRIPDDVVSRRARTLFRTGLTIGAFFVAAGVVGAFVSALAGLFVVPACIAGVALLVAIVLYIQLIDRLRKALVGVALQVEPQSAG